MTISKLKDFDIHVYTSFISACGILQSLSSYYNLCIIETTTFYSILVQKILKLIEQNENTQVEVTKKAWAVREAMDPHRLQEGGTFLNTLLKRIDSTLTKLLAYIVEFVDQRNNLRLCLDENLRILWLKVFENEHLCQFSYDAIVERDDVTPVVQKLGSILVGEYECHLPFSWIFLHAMEAHMKTVVLDMSKIGNIT